MFQIGDQGPHVGAFIDWLNRKFGKYAGIKNDQKYGLDEARVVADAMRRYQMDVGPSVRVITLGGQQVRVEGAIATDEFLRRAAWHPPLAPRHRYELQGVGGDSRAFLNPPDAPSYQTQTNRFAATGISLFNGMTGPVVLIGYSMGGESVCKTLKLVPPQQRSKVGTVITLGDPSMPPGGSLLGDAPGQGISGNFQPDWCHDRYFSYEIEGDWYPRARGLLPFLYRILSRAALTMDFALYLFTEFPLDAMQQLMGLKSSDDPLAGVLGPLAGLMTGGPLGVVGALLGPAQIFMILPQLIQLLFDAVSFLMTQAHGMYFDARHRHWDGMTAVDHAVQLVQDRHPGGATIMLFPGTWSQWNQLFQFDIGIRLYNLG